MYAIPLCDVHNCAMPLRFIQAPGEARGVGRWVHAAARLNTADRHAARPGTETVQTTPLVYCAHPDHYTADHLYSPGVCIAPGRVTLLPNPAYTPMQAGATTTSRFD